MFEKQRSYKIDDSEGIDVRLIYRSGRKEALQNKRILFIWHKI